MKISINAANLTKIYTEGPNKVNAVSSVSLQLYEGDVIGLFGPSGSGKTTLLSLIGCILRSSAGSLQIYGTDITSLKDSALSEIRRRYLSFIFQGFNLFPALTAYENVLLVINLKGMKGARADKRAKDLLNDVGLSERMHFLPRDLSGGQKQRVSVARALAADSPIILADEPTANLDFANGRKVMEILKRIASEQKKCVVVATHDGRLDTLFERILVMEDGKIVEDRGMHHER